MIRRRQPSRFAQRRSPPSRQFYARVGLGLSLLLTIAAGVFVYQVSPLRDPAFQPNSANAGSLLPWMQGVGEGFWSWGAAGLAGLLAANVVWLLLVSGSTTSRTGAGWALQAAVYGAIGLALFVGLWFLFIGYLLAQWLVD